MLGTAPGNSLEGPVEGAPAEAFAGAPGRASPAACVSPADNSPEFMRTSLSPSPGTLGCASWFTFSWKDCALAAAAAGRRQGGAGRGRFYTRTAVTSESA